MSAQFIVEYAGVPIEFDLGIHLVDEQFATRFTSEPEAWIAAQRECLNPDRVTVVNLYERNQRAKAKAGE